MHRSRVCGRVPGLLVALWAVAVGPDVASAHEVGVTRFESPIPFGLLLAAAGATVGLTALWVGVSGRTSAPATRQRLLVSLPERAVAGARRIVGVGFLAGFAAIVVAGLVGPQTAAENLATVVTWPVWVRGIALVAILAGSPWAVLSPWRTLYGGLTRLEGGEIALVGSLGDRLTRPKGASPTDEPVSERSNGVTRRHDEAATGRREGAVDCDRPDDDLGHWPAAVGFLALLGVIAPLTLVPRSPRLTAVVLACYAIAMLGGAVLVGPAWFRRADPLGVFYRLLARVAPVTLTDRREAGYGLTLRPPWQDCARPVADRSLVVFIVATVYTVSFDGFANTRAYQSLLFAVRDGLGTGTGTSWVLYGVGLAGFLVVFGLVVTLVERLGASTDRDRSAALRWFAPTILPIATAYEIAHNYPFVLRNVGRLLEFLLAPLATDVGTIDPLWWLSVPAFWASQVALIVLGHVVAAVAAHVVAVGRYDAGRVAVRAHAPLLLLMIGYTVLSLWIVSQPVLAGYVPT